MKKSGILKLCLLGLYLFAGNTFADVQFIGFGQPQIGIRVGSGGSTIDEVGASLTAAQIDAGTPVTLSPTIFIGAFARRPFSFPFPVFQITVDSSANLTNGSTNIDWTEITWTSQDGTVANGAFDGTASQVILGPIIAAFLIRDRLTFSYENSQIVEHGAYTARVVYTAVVP